MEFKHISVLLKESVDALSVNETGIYADGTLGGGGHSLEILKKGCAHLIGIDRDTEAIQAAKNRLAAFNNVTYVHDNYKNIKEILKNEGIDEIDGAVIDLGISSYQIDNSERGFSYMEDAPLDMRMDKSQPFSAYDVVNTYEEEQLSKIIFDYGEERFARKIAHLIAERRKIVPVKTTLELAGIIKEAIPAKSIKKGSHPAKRTFQAIRIEVNGELSDLKCAVLDFFDSLKSGGRLCIITFHSLEDRIVKQTFADLAKGCTCPSDFPICVCGNKPKGRVITRKPILPTDAEMTENKRSKSAKLRIIEKL